MEQTQAPWYSGGLQFSCTQCGNCCTGSPGYVWVDEDDLRAIAEYLDKPLGEIRLMHARPAKGRLSLREYANGDCTFFDPETRRCRIYPVRPVQCRTWPFWRSNLATEQDWQQTAAECPGIGRGEFVSLEEIERTASQNSHC